MPVILQVITNYNLNFPDLSVAKDNESLNNLDPAINVTLSVHILSYAAAPGNKNSKNQHDNLFSLGSYNGP